MSPLGQIVCAAAILANAVVYGVDVFAGLVMRSVYAQLDDATVNASAGWGHHFADKRMPPIGTGGILTTVLAIVVGVFSGHTPAALAAAVALVCLLVWLALYIRIAKPINTAQKTAALANITPPNARALQNSWDAIIGYRIALQTAALAALSAALALF
jgi:hypothetical protein